MCLFYFGIASANSYFNIVFWNIAPRSRFPEFWASVGRSIDAFSVIILGLLNFSSLSVIPVLALNIAVIVVVIMTMAVNGDFNVFTAEPAQTTEALSQEEMLEILNTKYSLTPAEMKVLRELVLTNEKQAAIAHRLDVKIGTVQFHTTNIYRKTGASTRKELCDLYYNAAVK